jgi:hypothetical protein
MRFCYVTPGSHTPRRYRCQPDLSEQGVRDGIPQLEVGPDAEARFVGGEGGHPEPLSIPSSPRGLANLELTLEIDNAAPAGENLLTGRVTLENHGPRDAVEVEVTFTVTPDCLDIQDEPATHGALEESVWKVGTVKAGTSATLKATLEVTEECHEEPEVWVKGAITAYSLVDDGRDFLEERIRQVRRRVQPRFNSVRYGTPTYAQLAHYCPDEITRGADDESEMGAFHDLFQPQRAANLEARLDEFVPAGMDVGIIYGS